MLSGQMMLMDKSGEPVAAMSTAPNSSGAFPVVAVAVAVGVGCLVGGFVFSFVYLDVSDGIGCRLPS